MDFINSSVLEIPDGADTESLGSDQGAHDPLSFLNVDKKDLEEFLVRTRDIADMSHQELSSHLPSVKPDVSFDLDEIHDGTSNGQLSDVDTWYGEPMASYSSHTHNQDSNDAHLVTVDPQAILPMIEEPSQQPPSNLLSFENANSAAMRLHANCSNLQNNPDTSENTDIVSQNKEAARILAVANSPAKSPSFLLSSSPAKTSSQNFILSNRGSPLKPQQTYVLNGTLSNQGTVICSPSPLYTNRANYIMSSPKKLHVLASDKNGSLLFKNKKALLSPSQSSPVLLGQLQTGVKFPQGQVFSSEISNVKTVVATSTTSTTDLQPDSTTKIMPKPPLSYSCLIYLALKNCATESLPVAEIYNFMCHNFPFFKTAKDGWKNSVRHNLSLNKCFCKVENPKLSQGAKKGCLWGMSDVKKTKMEEEIIKCGKKDPVTLIMSMAYPQELWAWEIIKKVAAEPIEIVPGIDNSENLTPAERLRAAREYASKHAPADSLHFDDEENIDNNSEEDTPVSLLSPIKREYSTPIKKDTILHKSEVVPVTLFRTSSPCHDSIVNNRVSQTRISNQPVQITFQHLQSKQGPPLAKRARNNARTINENSILSRQPHMLQQQKTQQSQLQQKNVQSQKAQDDATDWTHLLNEAILKNEIADSDELENLIDVEFYNNAEFSSPLHRSPNTQTLSTATAVLSPSVQARHTYVHNPSPLTSSSPNTVRTNLFGVTTPTIQSVFT